MQPVADRIGVAESVDDSRKTALDQMRANPDLGGFLAFGSQGPIGAARAIQERGKAGKVFVVGPFSPGQGRKLLHDGVLTGGFIWNPMQAGEVFVTLGKMLATGQEIKDGMEIPGLGVVHPDFQNHTIIADQLVPLNEKTVDDLAKLGL
jgi:simple sugar transport system substrate-binding protein